MRFDEAVATSGTDTTKASLRTASPMTAGAVVALRVKVSPGGDGTRPDRAGARGPRQS